MTLICHTNRVDTANPRDRYGATGELRKKARMTLYCLIDEDSGALIVGPEKANGVAAVTASMFGITPVAYWPPTQDHDGTVPLLTYRSESQETVRAHIADAYTAGHDNASAKADAVGWLAAYLGDGPHWVNDIFRSGEAFTYSKDQLKRAKTRLHVESQRDSTADAWFWHLPQHQGSTPGPSVAPLLPCNTF